jgi:CTP synthase
MLKLSTIEKVAMFCKVDQEQIVAIHDVSSVYHVPMLLEQQGLTNSLQKILKLDQMTISQELVVKGVSTWAS